MINSLMISLVMNKLFNIIFMTYNIIGDLMRSISVSDLKKINNPIIIDIRDNQKYNDNHIMSAKNINYEQLMIYPYKYLSKNNVYYIYCQRGIKSRNLCNILSNNGYNVININGGYEAWILNE